MAPDFQDWDKLQFIDIGRFSSFISNQGNYSFNKIGESSSAGSLDLSYDICRDGMPVASLRIGRHEVSDAFEESAELTFTTENAFEGLKAPVGRSLCIRRGKNVHANYLEMREFHDGERVYGGVLSHFPANVLLRTDAELRNYHGVNKK